jgi:hypothetical protein
MLRKFRGSIVSLGSALVLVSVLASSTALTALAGEEQEVTYKPIQAISRVLGSKRASGYFSRDGNVCYVTLMVAEEVDLDVAMPTSAARVRVSLMPGQTVQLDSNERKFLDITCGPEAETVVARSGVVASETH